MSTITGLRSPGFTRTSIGLPRGLCCGSSEAPSNLASPRPGTRYSASLLRWRGFRRPFSVTNAVIQNRDHPPSPTFTGSVHSKGFSYDLPWICRFQWVYTSLLAEFVEKRDVVAKHCIEGAGMLHGGIEFAFDAGNGLEKELAEVAKRVGGLVRDALFG